MIPACQAKKLAEKNASGEIQDALAYIEERIKARAKLGKLCLELTFNPAPARLPRALFFEFIVPNLELAGYRVGRLLGSKLEDRAIITWGQPRAEVAPVGVRVDDHLKNLASEEPVRSRLAALTGT